MSIPDQSDAASGNGRLRRGAVLGKLRWGFCSDPGPVREHNEDYAGAFAPTTPYDAWDRGPLFVVADGMGGHAAGEVASRLAVERLIGSYRDGTPAPPHQAMRHAMRAANEAVLGAAMEPGRRGMGTTLAAVALQGTEVVAAHVGDSRAYLVHGDSCTQLTTDHSRVAEMLRMKLLTPEQAATHPARSQLTRSIGSDPFVKVDIARHPLTRDDVLVLCSDGLWDTVGRQDLIELSAMLVRNELPTSVDCAEALVRLAIDRRSSDNVTAVVVHVTSDAGIPPTASKRVRFRRGRA